MRATQSRPAPPHQETHRIVSVRRLQVILALFIVCLLVGLSGLNFFLVSKIFAQLTPSMRAELIWKTRRGATELARASDVGLALDDNRAVLSALGAYTSDADVVGIIGVNAQGKRVAQFGRIPEEIEDPFQGDPDTPRFTDDFMVAWARAQIEGSQVGRVALVTSTQRLQAGERLRRDILFVAAVSCGAALVMCLFFVSFYMGPVIRLTHTSLQKARDMEIAQRIQGSILPRGKVVEGLEIAAEMRPAEDVGGDYYDIIPVPGGAWLAIGDVSGHGVQAGLIMLMVQSVVAGLTKQGQVQSPQDVVDVLNRVLHENIRDRMGSDDFVTFTVLRYEADGRITFAGAHEDILIWRAKEGRCQTVETPGTWLGAIRNVRPASVESVQALEPGDLVLLYTDGITEAMNHEGEQFGTERLAAILEAHQSSPVRAISEAILRDVSDWMRRQDDDLTVLLFRYQGQSAQGEIV